VFALHGEAYYRRIEREILTRVLATPSPMVLATGGSIVNDPTNFALLRARCRTVWLRAGAEDHWNRGRRAGRPAPDGREPHAFSELRALMTAREKLYARAEHTIETAGRRVPQVVSAIAELVA